MKNQNIMFTESILQMLKARLFRSFLALGVVALITQVSLPRAEAYDLSSLNGSYAGSGSGFTPKNGFNPPPVLRTVSVYAPEYSVGLFTFDGAGGCTALLVFNFGDGLIVGDNWDLNLHRDIYRECERYRHHDFAGWASPPFRDLRWRKRD